MEIVNVLADKSKLEFEGLANCISDSQLWRSMFNQCELANNEIDKARFSLNKTKRKLQNVLKLVKVFNTMVFDIPDRNFVCSVKKLEEANVQLAQMFETSDPPECANCETFCNYIEHLESEVQTADVCIPNTQIAVISKKDKTQSDAATSSHIPALVEPDDNPTDSEVRRHKLLERASKLKLQIHDQLMKILRDIPRYEMRMDAFHNADVFESFCDRFNLTDEQRNKLFCMWLPGHMSRRLVKNPYLVNGIELHSDTSERLSQLLLFTTGEEVPTADILDSLKVTVNDDPYDFRIKFAKAYKLVYDLNVENVAMLKAFVRKFTYLDPASIVLASQKNTLDEAAEIIDNIRRQLKRTNLKSRISVIQNHYSRPVDQSRFKLGNTAPFRSDRVKQFTNREPTNREPLTCFFCKRPGHFKYQCRKYLKQIERPNVGKENGLVSIEPSAPSPTEEAKVSTMYTPLRQELRNIALNHGLNVNESQSADVRQSLLASQ